MARKVKVPKPLRKEVTTTVDVSYLPLKKGQYVTIVIDGGRSVEIVCKEDGTLQVCLDDVTFETGVHRFKDIYGLKGL